MKAELILDSFDKDIYNKVARHPLQSWQWGEARKAMGIEVIRIGEFASDDTENDVDTQLVNVFQMTLHPIPYTPYKIGYLPRSVIPTQPILDFLSDFGRKNNLVFIKIEPNVPIKKPNSDDSLIMNNSSLVISSHPLFPKWTQTLDITPSEDVLLANMKSKTRYNIKLAQRKGVTVREESNEKGFEIFSKLYFETTKRQHYFGHTPRYHQIVWNALKDEIAHILVAYYEGQPLVAYELFLFKNTLYYPYGGSSDAHRNVMAANLMMWEAIRFGKNRGATYFDLWGSIAPDYDQNDPWAGFTRFKEGYGTQFTEMLGSFDLIINPFGYSIYNQLYKLRKILLSLKK